MWSGAYAFSEKLNIATSFRLPDRCSVFDAEMLAIAKACDILNGKLDVLCRLGSRTAGNESADELSRDGPYRNISSA